MRLVLDPAVLDGTALPEPMEGSVDEVGAYLLRLIRRRFNVPQRDLAAALGVSQPQVANLESGKQRIHLVHLDVLAFIADADLEIEVRLNKPKE